MTKTNDKTDGSAAITNAKKSAPPTLRQMLEGPQFAEQVANALPKHLSQERFIRVAITAMTKTPKLALCHQKSFFMALLQLSALGLEPDGRQAHLIPFKNSKMSLAAGREVCDCQLIIDWKGLAELAMRSGMVSNLHADVIYAGDLFVYSSGEVTNHLPHWLRTDAAKPGKQGARLGFYAQARFKDGSQKAEVMSFDQVQAIRARSASGQSGPWVTDSDEMGKKTAFRRLSKWLPLSPEFRDAIALDDESNGMVNVTPERMMLDPAAGLGAALAPYYGEEEESGPEPEKQAVAVTEVQKKEAQDALEGAILDDVTTEAQLYALAQRSHLVPDGSSDLFWDLPASALVKLAAMIPSLKKEGK